MDMLSPAKTDNINIIIIMINGVIHHILRTLRKSHTFLNSEVDSDSIFG